MVGPIHRKESTLRRVLFLCAENYHDSRFCEELFNSHARIEGLNAQAISRAVGEHPTAKNDGPMSLEAIGFLRALGAAPVNHLRLPLEASEFDFAMSGNLIALDTACRRDIERRWPGHAALVRYWSVPRETQSRRRAGLSHLARRVDELLTSLHSGAGHRIESVRAPAGGRVA